MNTEQLKGYWLALMDNNEKGLLTERQIEGLGKAIMSLEEKDFKYDPNTFRVPINPWMPIKPEPLGKVVKK